MSGGGYTGSQFVTRAEYDRLASRLRRRFDAIDGAIEYLERDHRPYGDGRRPLSLCGWERLVDRRLAKKRKVAA